MERYAAQILFAPLGREGQKRLLAARVAVVGCGGLGTNIINLLVRGGVGNLRVIDGDAVEETNLHRQVLYYESDAKDGVPKVEAVLRRAAKINSSVRIDARVARLVPENAEELLSGVDLILDGTDNFETRYLINDFAVKNRVPWIYGGALGSQAACMTFVPGGPCLRCLWPDCPPTGTQPTSRDTGVLPQAPAVAGAFQAASAMRLLAGHAPSEHLIQMDVWDQAVARLHVKKNARCPCCAEGVFDFLQKK